MSNNKGFVIVNPKESASLRLFCFPYAGAGASVFNRWYNCFDSHVEVCTAQYPGREGRYNEPFLKDINELVRDLAGSIGHLLDKPFVFLGHSMGALIAFELARLLQKEGRKIPMHLIVSGFYAPQNFVFRNVIMEGKGVRDNPDDIMIDWLLRNNIITQEICQDKKFLKNALELLRSDCEALENYTYEHGDRLHCSITAFGGTEDDILKKDIEPWKEQTNSLFYSQEFKGDHFFLWYSKQEVIDAISKEISELMIIQ